MERKRKRDRSQSPPRKRSRHGTRARSRSRSHSPSRHHSKPYHQRSRHNTNRPTHYDEAKMSKRLQEIKHLRNELAKPRSYHAQQYNQHSEQEYMQRAEKRRTMKATISVWMESPERDTAHNSNPSEEEEESNKLDIEDEPVETFNEERKKHVKERKHHIKRHETVMNQRTFHSSDTDSESVSSSSSSESSSDSSTDSEYERR
eukprot:216772_1